MKKYDVAFNVLSLSYILRWTGWGLQLLNGSPMYPGKQLHEGTWLSTRHKAFWPQVPGHGSWHLLRTHALSDAQSEFTIHSGLQLSYGLPKYSGKHVHDPAPFCSLQTALEPHGDGSHGVDISCSSGVAEMDLNWKDFRPRNRLNFWPPFG